MLLSFKQPLVIHHPANGRKGAAAVEFAFVFPVIIMVVFGMIEMSRAMMLRHQLNEGARRGAREAVLAGKTNDDVKAVINNYLTPDVRPYVTITMSVNGNFSKNVSAAATGDEIDVYIKIPDGNIKKVTWLNWDFFNTLRRGRFMMIKEA